MDARVSSWLMGKTKPQTIKINDVELHLESDVIDGIKMDTRVSINDCHLCTITGDSIKQFADDLAQLIAKYQI